MKGKKGQVSLYIVFILVAITIIVITSVLAPMGVLFSTEMVHAGEGILLDANESIQGITNTTIRDSIMANIGNAFENADNNIEVYTFMFRYGWIIVLGLVGIIVFLYARRMVEFSTGRIMP